MLYYNVEQVTSYTVQDVYMQLELACLGPIQMFMILTSMRDCDHPTPLAVLCLLNGKSVSTSRP
jgi:hypothetical protein